MEEFLFRVTYWSWLVSSVAQSAWLGYCWATPRVKIKNVWSYISTPLNVFVECYAIRTLPLWECSWCWGTRGEGLLAVRIWEPGISWAGELRHEVFLSEMRMSWATHRSIVNWCVSRRGRVCLLRPGDAGAVILLLQDYYFIWQLSLVNM